MSVVKDVGALHLIRSIEFCVSWFRLKWVLPRSCRFVPSREVQTREYDYMYYVATLGCKSC
jgi:hypothetical protein